MHKTHQQLKRRQHALSIKYLSNLGRSPMPTRRTGRTRHCWHSFERSAAFNDDDVIREFFPQTLQWLTWPQCPAAFQPTAAPDGRADVRPSLGQPISSLEARKYSAKTHTESYRGCPSEFGLKRQCNVTEHLYSAPSRYLLCAGLYDFKCRYERTSVTSVCKTKLSKLKESPLAGIEATNEW